MLSVACEMNQHYLLVVRRCYFLLAPYCNKRMRYEDLRQGTAEAQQAVAAKLRLGTGIAIVLQGKLSPCVESSPSRNMVTFRRVPAAKFR